MASTTFDDDVDFETEEETSEFEEEEEPISTVTVKLPSKPSVVPKSSPKTETPPTASKPSPPVEDNNACLLSDESYSKKSSKSKSSLESSEKIFENGHCSNFLEKHSKSDTRAALEKEKNEIELKLEKPSSKSKVDLSDVGEDSSKKHKSERRRSKEEKKKDLVAIDGVEDVEAGSKRSSKSKKEKNSEQDENSGSAKKRDKHSEEEGGGGGGGRSSKSKKEKREKTPSDDTSNLQLVGEVSEVKEVKEKKSKKKKYLDLEKLSPSSSSSDMEKIRSDKIQENKMEEERTKEVADDDDDDDRVKTVKVVKKKSKKSSALQLEQNEPGVENMEASKTVDDPIVANVQMEISRPAPNEGITGRLETIKRFDVSENFGEFEVDKGGVELQDDENGSKLSVTPSSKKDREPVSPDRSMSSSSFGRIEQTRNYLKALTPEDGYKSDEEKPNQKASAIFELAKRDEPEDEIECPDVDGKEHIWEPKEEPKEREGKVVENEDSDFTYRRKSMDEFIKKILAEAREENQKLKGEDAEKSKKPPSAANSKAKSRPVTSAIENGDDGSTDDYIESREIDDINKYFSRRQTELKADAVEEKPLKDKQMKEPQVVVENGYTRREIPKIELDIDAEAKEFLLKPKKSQLSSYLDLDDDDDPPGRKPKFQSTAAPKKSTRNALMNGDISLGRDEDDEETADIGEFLTKFKRERQTLFGGPGAGRFDPEIKRSAETEELIRDKTRNIKSVIDQQKDICQNVRAVSKQLDDLEKELREVRQISLDRRNRMEAMENAVNAEYKMYEIEHQAAVDRVKDKKPIQKFTQEVKDQMIANIQQQSARSKKGDRYRGELTADDVASSIRRRVGSISSQAALMDEQENFMASSTASSSPYHSFAASRGRGASSDMDPYLSSFLTIDRRRDGAAGGGSRSRLSFIDNGNDFDDLTAQPAMHSSLFSKPKSRASVATMDTSASISADDFLSKMRSKYSFLNPSQTGDDLPSIRFQSGSRGPAGSGYRSNASAFGGHDSYRSRLDEPPSSAYLSIRSVGSRGPSPSSVPDVPGSRYSLAAGGSRYYGSSGSSHVSPHSGYDLPKSRRASSVADVRSSVHYDRHLGGYTTGGYTGGSSYGGNLTSLSKYSPVGATRYSDSSTTHQYAPSHHAASSGEFKSRFLDKVREKRSSLGGPSTSSHDLADRVKAKLNSSKSAASYDHPAPTTRLANVENQTAEAK